MVSPKTTSCNCCGSTEWEFAFTERGVDMGRCPVCGLYYVHPLPTEEERHAEVVQGMFGDDEEVLDADTHARVEERRRSEFRGYRDLVQRYAPQGRVLDIGCGGGVLVQELQGAGREVEGIELSTRRRAVAQKTTGAKIYDRPLEDLHLPDSSLAAVTMISVFSHLTDPKETFEEINRVLVPDGIMLLRTGEIGPGAQRHHAFDWALGDHLYFLGEHTIEWYAPECGFEIVHRDTERTILTNFTTDFFRTPGRSGLRNAVKMALSYVPGAVPALRWGVAKMWQKDNPLHTSTLVLRKAGSR